MSSLVILNDTKIISINVQVVVFQWTSQVTKWCLSWQICLSTQSELKYPEMICSNYFTYFSNFRFTDSSVAVRSLALFKLVPELADLSKASFYSYKGSLTTPPCYQSVSWIVLKNPVDVGTDMVGMPVLSFSKTLCCFYFAYPLRPTRTKHSTVLEVRLSTVPLFFCGILETGTLRQTKMAAAPSKRTSLENPTEK